jgi:hypothetical protein
LAAKREKAEAVLAQFLERSPDLSLATAKEKRLRLLSEVLQRDETHALPDGDHTLGDIVAELLPALQAPQHKEEEASEAPLTEALS